MEKKVLQPCFITTITGTKKLGYYRALPGVIILFDGNRKRLDPASLDYPTKIKYRDTNHPYGLTL